MRGHTTIATILPRSQHHYQFNLFLTTIVTISSFSYRAAVSSVRLCCSVAAERRSVAFHQRIGWSAVVPSSSSYSIRLLRGPNNSHYSHNQSYRRQFTTTTTTEATTTSATALVNDNSDDSSDNPTMSQLRLTNAKVQHVAKERLPGWMQEERTRVLFEDSSLISRMFPERKSDMAADTAATDADIATATDTNQGASVVYWMQRDVRTKDNWALLLAAHFAMQQNCLLRVVYALPPPPISSSSDDDDDDDDDTKNDTDNTKNDTVKSKKKPAKAIPDLIHLPMTERHGKFLVGGLECVHDELVQLKVPLHVVMASSHDQVGVEVAQLVSTLQCSIVITDFSPLRHHREWIELQFLSTIRQHQALSETPESMAIATAASTVAALYQVDAHNIVPVWIASNKREYGAHTIRKKINSQYEYFLRKFPKLYEFKFSDQQATTRLPPFRKATYERYLRMDPTVEEAHWATPGTKAAFEQMQYFFNYGLNQYHTQRNDPTYRTVCSKLSPWINHGQVSFQRIAMLVKKLNRYQEGTAAFLEEGIIRRELSDNFVYYEPYKYDSIEVAPDWARETLRVHATDNREYLYTLKEFEYGKTHDDLWNAAQLQAVQDGKMHGFLRMYWAKKILEWTPSPEIALKTALYLNDKYNLDGRDPNGFVGVGWSIMGIHDRAWEEREIFGKIRYMNYAGCKRKYRIGEFISKYPEATDNAEMALKKLGLRMPKKPKGSGTKRKTRK